MGLKPVPILRQFHLTSLAIRSAHNLFQASSLFWVDTPSHVSLSFIEYCEQQYIIPLCLPPYSTHILRPLNVGSSLHLLRPIRHVVQGIAAPPRAKAYISPAAAGRIFSLLQRSVSVCCGAAVIITHAPSYRNTCEMLVYCRRAVYCPPSLRLC